MRREIFGKFNFAWIFIPGGSGGCGAPPSNGANEKNEKMKTNEETQNKAFLNNKNTQKQKHVKVKIYIYIYTY